jgi:hypothetical protein
MAEIYGRSPASFECYREALSNKSVDEIKEYSKSFL